MADRKRLRVGWRDTDLARRQSLLPLILQQHPTLDHVQDALFAPGCILPSAFLRGDLQPKFADQPFRLGYVRLCLCKNAIWHNRPRLRQWPALRNIGS